MALSITSMACCETYKVIIFGTSKGKVAFYEVKTRGNNEIYQIDKRIKNNNLCYK